MYLIEILLPAFDNSGRDFGAGLFDQVQQELAEHFGGVTAFTRTPAHGEVKDGGKVVRDEIILIEVMAEAIDRGWWRDYRRSLERRFAQDEIVVRATMVERL
jgi:hypothetical protein